MSVSDSKKASVSQASGIKQSALSGDLSASQIGQTNLAQSLEAFNFLNADSVTRGDLFGGDANDAFLSHGRQVNRDLATELSGRTAAEILGDSVTGIAQGATNVTGGMGAVLGGMISDGLGNSIRELTASTNEGLGNFKSDALNNKSELYNRISNLRAQDIENYYEGDDSILGGIRRFGTEALTGTQDLIRDPAVLGDVVAQGGGSLIPTAIAGALTGGSLPTIAGVTGLMGAGGAYSEASERIMGMSHEQLMDGSQEYRNLIADGISVEDAKLNLANRAGLAAAPIAGVVGTFGGAATAKFAGAPFSVARGTVGDKISDVGEKAVKEYAEEFIQGGTEQLASNIGVQRFGDNTQDILAGVGTAAAVEGMAGLGTVGATQLPGAIVSGGTEAANQVRQAVTPTPAQSTPTLAQTNNNTIKAATQGISEAVADETITEADPINNDLNQVAERVISVASVPVLEVEANLDVFQRLLGSEFQVSGDYDRIALVNAVRDQIYEQNEGLEPELGLKAIQFIQDSIKQYSDLIAEGMPASIDQLADDNPIKVQYNQIIEAANAVINDPDIQQLIEFANEQASETVSNIEVTTPENALVVANATDTNLDAITPDQARSVLAQEVTLESTQAAPLNALVIMDDIQKENANKREEYKAQYEPNSSTEKRVNVDLVNSEIVDTFNKNNKLPSAKSHLINIQNALAADNISLAQTAYEDLVNFAQHMQNKLSAANESYAGREGKQIPFQAYGPNGWHQGGAVYVNPRSNNSMYLAESIADEAEGMKAIADRVGELYQPLGITPVAIEPVQAAWRTYADVFPEPTVVEPEASPELIVEPIQDSEPDVASEPVQELPAPVTEPEVETSSGTVAEVTEPSAEVEVVSEPVTEANTESEPQATEPTQERKSFLPKLTENKQVVSDIMPTTYESPLVSRADLDSGNKFNTAKTRLYQFGSDPLKTINAIVKNTGSKNIDNALNAHVDPKIKKAMSGVVERIIPQIKDQINKGITPEVLEVIKKNPRMISSKAYGFMMFVDLETNTYPEPIANAMAIAGAEFAAGLRRVMPQDAERISKSTGIPVSALTPEAIKVINSGVHTTIAASEISKRIGELLGHEFSNNTPVDFGQNLMDKLAVQVLQGLADMNNPLIKRSEPITVSWSTVSDNGYSNDDVNEPSEDIKRFQKIVVIEPTETALNMGSALGSFSEFMSDLMVPGKEKEFFIGEPPSEIRQTSKKNSSVKLSKKQKELEKKISNTPFYANTNMWRVVEAIGGDTLATLLGARPFNSDIIHEATAATQDGKNRSIVNSIMLMNELSEGMEAYAQQNGIDNSEVPVYFPTSISSVGRLHMDGTSVQNNKYLREMLSTTRATYDLSDTNSNDSRMFNYALAQALGVKTHKLSESQVFEKLDEALQSYDDIINMLVDVLKGRGANSELLTQTFTEPMEMKTLHGLMAAAEYRIAEEDGTLGSFNSNLSIELDGVTDGPLNALVHFWSGKTDGNYISMIEAGGRYLGNTYQNLADYFSVEGNKDIYEKTVDTFNEYLNNIEDENASKLLKLFSNAGLAEVVLDEQDQEIGFSSNRDAVKNPLTVFLYASGLNGINEKIVAKYEDSLYQAISDVLARNGSSTDLANDPLFTGLTERDIRIIFGVGYADMLNRTWRIPAETKDIVKEFYAKPLFAALNAQMGGMNEVMKRIISASQIHSAVEQEMFDKALEEIVIDAFPDENVMSKNGGIKPSYYGRLTPNQYAEALRVASAYGSTYNFQNQTISLSTKDNSVENTESAKTPDERFYSNIRLPMPSDVGVKAGANINISVGDGNTIMTAYTSAGSAVMENTLPIFDGIDVTPKNVQDISTHLNKSVELNWESNPIEAIYDRWNNLIQSVPEFDSLSDNTLRAIATAFADPKERKKIAAAVDVKPYAKAAIKELSRLLKQDRDLISARKLAEKEFAVNNEHMAAVGVPYTRDGLVGSNNEEVAKLLEQRIRANMDQVPTKTSMDANLYEALSEAGRLVETEQGSVVSLSRNNLGHVLRSSTKLPRYIRELAPKLSRNLDTNARIYIGSREALEDLKRMNGGDQTLIEDGQYDPSTGSIYLVENTSEALVHELIHAATFDKMALYYEDRDQLTNVDQEAIQRLEGIMNEVVFDADFSAESVATTAAIQGLQNAVLNAPTAAHKLSEFAAWSLANQSLTEKLTNTRLRNPLLRATNEIIKFIKRMFFGVDTRVSSDVLSNIRFNVEILAASKSVFDPEGSYGAMNLNNGSRSASIQQRFARKAAEAVRGRLAAKQGKGAIKRTWERGLLQAKQEAYRLNKAGFSMNADDVKTFSMIHAMMVTDIQLDSNVLTKVNSLFDHFINNVTVDDFMVEPTSTNPNDLAEAQDMYEAVLTGSTKKDAQHRSGILPSFIALAQTNDRMRTALDRVGLPKIVQTDWSSANGALDAIGQSAIDGLTTLMSGKARTSKTMTDALDNLAGLLAELDNQNSDSKITKIASIPSIANDYLASGLENLTTGLEKQLAPLKGSKNKFLSGTATAISIAVSPLNKKNAKNQADALTSLMNRTNKIPRMAQEFFNEIRSMTADNEGVISLAKRAKSHVSGIRQDYRETTPKLIKSFFSDKMTEGKWTTLHTSLGKTDITSLLGSMNMSDVVSIISNENNLDKAIRDAETDLANITGNVNLHSDYLTHSRTLAKYMVTGVLTEGNTLRNAEAISRLFGSRNLPQQDISLVNKINELISLYALKETGTDNLTELATILKDESEGINTAIKQLKIIRDKENAKVIRGSKAHLNGWKGFIPEEITNSQVVLVAPMLDREQLERQGFIYEKKYPYRDSEGHLMGYFVSPIGTKATYQQGAMQTAARTYNGSQQNGGRSIHGKTAFVISDRNIVQQYVNRVTLSNPSGESTNVIYDENGQATAVEFMKSSEMLQTVKANTNLADMLGVWRGRQVEEQYAQGINKELIKELKSIYDKAVTDNRTNEFINLMDTEDKIYQEMWSNVPAEMREDIIRTFGSDGFFVRKDMINNALGYRSASIGDLFTGNTRINPKLYNGAIDFAVQMMGPKAYRYLVGAERLAQSFVSEAKNIIVIRSVIVPVANIMSNFLQLAAKGIGPVKIVKESLKKLNETKQYADNRKRLIKLELEKELYKDDGAKILKIDRQIQAIRDAHRRMSIWPIIEQFSTIAEDLSPLDGSLTGGKWIDAVEQAVDKYVPTGLQTAGKYAIMSRDTSLYKLMDQATQYGDFIAKSVLFDHLQDRGISESEAKKTITDDFVNYDYLPGRTRTYLDSVGITWFWNFKIRSIKVAISMIRENPLLVLLSLAGIASFSSWLDLGSPVTDNLIGKVADGGIDYSIGWWMLKTAPTLTPIGSILY